MKPHLTTAIITAAIALPAGYVASDLLAADATAAGKSDRQLQVEQVQKLTAIVRAESRQAREMESASRSLEAIASDVRGDTILSPGERPVGDLAAAILEELRRR
jgi:hypothetical protein